MLGIPQLDSLLDQFRYPLQPAARDPGWTSPTSIGRGQTEEADEEDTRGDPTPAPSRPYPQAFKGKPATVEITSRTSAAGKTTLIYYLSALSTLPRNLGGKESAVVYIDSDGRFSASRLLQIMLHQIQTHQTTGSNTTMPADSETKALALEALNHVHVFRPQSSSQLLSILVSLSSFLLDRTRHSSIYRPLGMIAIDSVTAFYWQDRFERDMAKLESPGRVPPKSRNAEIIERLKVLQDRFECVVVFSTNLTSSPSKSRHEQTSNQKQTPTAGPLLTPWTAYATLKLTLSRAEVPQFASHIGLEQCLRDREKRFEVVRHGRIVGSVEAGAKEGIRGETGKPAVGFRIGEVGVEFED